MQVCRCILPRHRFATDGARLRVLEGRGPAVRKAAQHGASTALGRSCRSLLFRSVPKESRRELWRPDSGFCASRCRGPRPSAKRLDLACPLPPTHPAGVDTVFPSECGATEAPRDARHEGAGGAAERRGGNRGMGHCTRGLLRSSGEPRRMCLLQHQLPPPLRAPACMPTRRGTGWRMIAVTWSICTPRVASSSSRAPSLSRAVHCRALTSASVVVPLPCRLHRLLARRSRISRGSLARPSGGDRVTLPRRSWIAPFASWAVIGPYLGARALRAEDRSARACGALGSALGLSGHRVRRPWRREASVGAGGKPWEASIGGR